MSPGWRLAAGCLLASWLAPAGIAAAGPAEERGLAIAEEAARRDAGWVDQAASLEMILRSRNRDQSTRRLRVRTLEVDADGDKSLIVFDSPGDIEGTAFLTFTHASTPDQQWIYLPALKRVKRISSVNKSGPFVGSEFAYEDLGSFEVAKYTYRWLRDETLDGRQTMVVERFPVYEHSGYTRQMAWIDGEMYRPLKVEYYDRKNALLKTLRAGQYTRYLDRYWRPSRVTMINHQSGRSTILVYRDYRFRNGFSEGDFRKSALERVR